MREITLDQGTFTLTDKVITIIEKRVTKFGNSAKLDCPRKYLGKRAYILVCED